MSDTHDQTTADHRAANAVDDIRMFTVDDALRTFAEHLVRAFQMPAEQALMGINRELAGNPETARFQLQLRASDLCGPEDETDDGTR